MTGRPYRLVLFDLDGVIIDSRKNMEVSWSAVRAAFGVTVPFERYFAEIGIPFADIMRHLGLAELTEPIKKVYDVTSSCRIDLIVSYAGCVETLEALRAHGIRTGIVTSKDEARTLEIIRKLDLLLDVIECPRDKSRGKPSPDPLLRAILSCQLDPADAVYIGDMQADEEAASRAGIDYLHAAWGYGQPRNDGRLLTEPTQLLTHALGAAERSGSAEVV